MILTLTRSPQSAKIWLQRWIKAFEVRHGEGNESFAMPFILSSPHASGKKAAAMGRGATRAGAAKRGRPQGLPVAGG